MGIGKWEKVSQFPKPQGSAKVMKISYSKTSSVSCSPNFGSLHPSADSRALELPLVDVVSTTIMSLMTLSRSQRRAAFGSIFLLNNISYLRTHLVAQPINEVDTLLSPQAKELLNSNFRTAKANYMDANLSPLLAILAEDKDKNKSSIKEKFTRFFDLLDELVERHAIAAVLPDDSEGETRGK
jgi:exocyst complex protein 7